jgi:inorganic triphosphatase YgiF
VVPERTISEAPQPVSQNTHPMKHDGAALMSPPQVRASAGTVGREIELKLHVAPSDLARLARHPALVGLQLGTAASTRLYTVYFDTPDLRLASFGVALRVRRQGAQYIQTVKTLGGGNSGDAAAVAVRREWDWTIAGEDPDVSLLTLEGIRGLVPQDALPEIRPLFTTDFQRTTLMLRPDPLTAIEVALDTGEIRAGTTYRPISEIELELKAGPVTALFDLARELQRIVPMRISADNKALAGFALVTGRLPEPAKAPPLGLTPAATVADGFRHIVRNCMSHVLANEACVLAGGSDEGIHQMRVALRRLRSAFGLFDDIIASGDAKALKDEVRWLMDRLGPARDWDILHHRFFQPYAEKHGHDEAIHRLGQAISSSRRSAHARASEALYSPRYTTLILALGSWLESGRWQEDADQETLAKAAQPLQEIAGAWLGERHRKSRKAGRQIREIDGEQRHRLRISFKKLRYGVEFFRGVYAAGAVRPYLEKVEALQESLGDLNDADVSNQLLKALVDDASKDVKTAAKGLCQWLERHARRRVDGLPGQWAEFEKAKPFWE